METHNQLARTIKHFLVMSLFLSMFGLSLAEPTLAQTPEPDPLTYLPLIFRSGKQNNPLPVHIKPDPSRATLATIGPEGGTLRTTAANGTIFELVIPPEALDFTEVITMTPAAEVDNLPLSKGLAGAVNLEPEGLTLYEPARLRIIPLSPLSGPLTLGFAYDDTGGQFHLRRLGAGPGGDQLGPSVVTGLDQPVLSLRGYGAGTGTSQDITRQQMQPLANPTDAVEQRLVSHSAIAKDILHDYYQNTLEPELAYLRTHPDSRVRMDKLARDLDWWLLQIEQWNLAEALHADITYTTFVFVLDILPAASEVIHERCVSQKRPEEAFTLLRWVRYARKFLPGAPQIAQIEARARKCLIFKVTFHSVITEGGFGDPYGYYYELRSELILKATAGTRATGKAPLHYVDAHWTGGTTCQFAVAGGDSTFDAQGTGLGFTITPVSRTSPAVNLTLRYNPGVPVEHTTITCPGAPPVIDTTTAWYVYFDDMHTYEKGEAGYQVTSQITGAGSFTGWIYHHTTSGPSGQAVIEDTEIEIEHVPEQ